MLLLALVELGSGITPTLANGIRSKTRLTPHRGGKFYGDCWSWQKSCTHEERASCTRLIPREIEAQLENSESTFLVVGRVSMSVTHVEMYDDMPFQVAYHGTTWKEHSDWEFLSVQKKKSIGGVSSRYDCTN